MPFFNHLIIPYSIKKIKFFFIFYFIYFFHSLFNFRLIFLDYNNKLIYNLNRINKNESKSARRPFLQPTGRKKNEALY